MTQPASAATVRNEPFVDFPLWGLRKALADHLAVCEGCKLDSPKLCRDAWYRDLLTNKIALAEWRQRHGR